MKKAPHENLPRNVISYLLVCSLMHPLMWICWSINLSIVPCIASKFFVLFLHFIFFQDHLLFDGSSVSVHRFLSPIHDANRELLELSRLETVALSPDVADAKRTAAGGEASSYSSCDFFMFHCNDTVVFIYILRVLRYMLRFFFYEIEPFEV